MNTPAISLEHITEKVRRRRPIRNLKGELIALDSQQLSILRYMCCQGLRHKQIAAEVGMSARYITDRAAEILVLTGCKTHAQLGAWAAKQGLV